MFEHTGFPLRERTGFEALDAGLLFFRRNFRKIQAAWLVPYLLIVIFGLAFEDHNQWIFWLGLWWLRPLWDRLILRRAAHIFFGAGGRARWKGTFQGLLSDLTWRRLSLWRHYAQPVRTLEGIRGKRLRKRVSFLHREFRGTALALGAVMFLLELTLLSGASAFLVNIVNFIPHGLRFALTWETPGIMKALTAGWAAITLFTIPASVCMGFSLYINRRVILEGWDLEIAFSRSASRMKVPVLPVILMVILFLGPAVPSALAEDSADTAPVESLEQILEDKDFGSEGTRTAWRWRNREVTDSSSLDNIPFEGGTDTLAAMLRILLISAGVFAVGAIIWINRHSLLALVTGRKNNAKQSMSAVHLPAGETVRVPSLAGAGALFESGDIRAAWSILYRNQTAVLESLMADPPGGEATEGDWLGRLKADDPAGRLIRRWRQVAYAHRNPGQDVFSEELQRLLEGVRGAAG